jgi:hypothetical protein
MLAGAALVVLTYLLLARLVIDVVFGDRGDNLLLVVLRRVTNPLVRAVGTITPRVVPGPLVTLCALVWVFALRIALVQVMAAMAMRRLFG